MEKNTKSTTTKKTSAATETRSFGAEFLRNAAEQQGYDLMQVKGNQYALLHVTSDGTETTLVFTLTVPKGTKDANVEGGYIPFDAFAEADEFAAMQAEKAANPPKRGRPKKEAQVVEPSADELPSFEDVQSDVA